MTTYHGKDGKVSVGANQVGELREFAHNEAAETADDTACGDAWNTHKVGHKSADGTIDLMFDPGDTNGQEALAVGASVSLKLYPIGDDTGSQFISCTATITGVGVAKPLRDVVTRSITYQANGAVTHGTEGS